jgi:MFS family permease
VKDTIHHINKETKHSNISPLKNIFIETSWLNKNLGSISQAGLVNNLNDGMIWGLLPILLIGKGFTLTEVGKLVAIYPVVWGLGQLFTGKMADHLNKKSMLFWGMFGQGLAIIIMSYVNAFSAFAILGVVLGIGTAVVYPTFLAAIADYTHPQQRAQSIGVFRLWRDLGYAIGAIVSGVVADVFGIIYSILLIGVITVGSALVIKMRMD